MSSDSNEMLIREWKGLAVPHVKEGSFQLQMKLNANWQIVVNFFQLYLEGYTHLFNEM